MIRAASDRAHLFARVSIDFSFFTCFFLNLKESFFFFQKQSTLSDSPLTLMRSFVLTNFPLFVETLWQENKLVEQSFIF